MRVKALRQKREAIDGAANADARAPHVAERSMLIVGVPNAGPLQAAAPVAALAACVDQRIVENASENEIDSHNAAFETGLSAQPYNQGSRRSGKTAPREGVGEATILSRSVGRALPANGRESPGRADQGGHDDGQTASASSGYCAASL